MATVLYIEDNLANRKLVQLLIARRSDLELISAETGREGLCLAHTYLPDIILLDISLPDIQGDQVLKQLRDNSQTSQIPVIAISGDGIEETRLRFPEFQAYLEKPVDIQMFYDTIDALLDKVA
ncbi:response regulator [Desulfosediminicola sp.]|uniref:response regulator n=1 Tax=Desulfosediminicola sp. TaxID=2886825 RepID=UPI003AF2D0E5